MIDIRKSEQRGRASFGWLDSRHTFSFGHYHDPDQMGFSALRVINDDVVKPSAGFDTHGHRDMEIISYVLDGVIEHKDSEGNIQSLPAGEFQLMSAGKGIYHSEYNGSTDSDLRFLQIWIQPNKRGGTPSYQQKDFGKAPGFTVIATPDGRDGTLNIKQNARLLQLILENDSSETFNPEMGSNVYVHVVAGELSVNDVVLSGGDGAKVSGLYQVCLKNNGAENVTALIFDLP
ncbi:pirin family protein [Grimontia kaedaensis]|uniref:Pirin family protein n=1 Tax=Grimontia kaedaensis TaxID=2872157 RepID=A0ABY4WX82_9GAMM|nr:pirin family protein [Grimontia kaedaensis]USH03591.1 pirin family protein [Grimontia kaedaensis]